MEETLVLGFNHEQQHQELLLTDLKHMLSHNPLEPVYAQARTSAPQASSSGGVPALRWVDIPGGLHTIGHEGSGFCFDHEGPRHQTLLQNARIASRLVTNGEYLEFMRDGAYQRFDLWLSEGWRTVREQGWCAPLYWVERDGEWWQFTLGGMRPVDPAEPVCHVSHYEADAFARWAGARLPTEAEWEVAAASLPTHGNFAESRAFHPSTAGAASGGMTQAFGDVLGVDAERIPALPRLSRGARRHRGVQRQVHVRPDGAAGRLLCNARVAHPGHVPQLLSAREPLAIHRPPPGTGRIAASGSGGVAAPMAPLRVWWSLTPTTIRPCHSPVVT